MYTQLQTVKFAFMIIVDIAHVGTFLCSLSDILGKFFFWISLATVHCKDVFVTDEIFFLNFSGFGAFPVLEVLDLSYNNLNENVLPGNFFKLGKMLFCSPDHAP